MKKYEAVQKKISEVLIFCFLVFVLAGCATMPVIRESDYFTFLSPDNDMYITLDVQKNKSTITNLLKKMSSEIKDKEINQIIDRTKTVYIGLSVGSDTKKQKFEICAVGNYPQIITSALTKAKGWTKNVVTAMDADGKSKRNAVYKHSSGISLALLYQSVIFICSDSVESNIASFYKPSSFSWPDYALETLKRNNNDEKIRAYIPNPEVLLPKILGLGVQLALDDACAVCSELFVPGLTGQYLTDIDLYFKDARAVKAAFALLKLASLKSGIEVIKISETQLAIKGFVLSLDTLPGMSF